MRKLTGKDLVVYGLVTSFGLGGIWVFLGTNLVIDHGVAVQVGHGHVETNMNKFNSTVETITATKTDDKTRILNEQIELAKKVDEERKRQLERARDSLGRLRMNDVSSYLQSQASKGGDPGVQVGQPASSPVVSPVAAGDGTGVKTGTDLPAPAKRPAASGAPTKGNVSVSSGTSGKTGTVVTPVPTSAKRRKRTKKLFDSTASADAAVGISGTPVKTAVQVYTMRASVYGPQIADEGKRLTFMLEEDVETRYGSLRSGALVDGIAHFGGGGGSGMGGGGSRLLVVISSIRVNGQGVVVQGKVKDTDGVDGIPIRGLSDGEYVKKNVTGQAITQAVSRMGIPIIGAAGQLASQRKMQSKSIPLTGDEKVIIEIE